MPQMSPLSWLSLYIIFTAALILFCMMNYYSFLPTVNKNKTELKSSTSSLQWKW